MEEDSNRWTKLTEKLISASFFTVYIFLFVALKLNQNYQSV